jgi:N-carbamoylputrescine amidase
MIVALASVNLMNNNVAFNLSQIDTYACEAAAHGIDVICFGESFLQGFDSLSWQYEKDKNIAVSQNSPEVAVIRQMTLDYRIDIMFGYIEHANESLYSSYALIAEGQIVQNYRRISRGWKKYSNTDYHYQEGTDTQSFQYREMECKIALCGDLWEFNERFSGCEILFWPVYVDYTSEEWNQNLEEYAEKAAVCPNTCMINSLSEVPKAIGGSVYFEHGSVKQIFPWSKEGLLIIDKKKY